MKPQIIIATPNETLLRTDCERVKHIDQEMIDVVKDMMEVMNKKNGVGIAAPQIGELYRICIVKLGRGEDRQVITMFNPVLVTHGEKSFSSPEGCLSIPNFSANVKRYSKISVTFTDIFGKMQVLEADGFDACIVQHEIDHLNGVLFTDHLTGSKAKKAEKHLNKLSKLK